MPHSACPVCKTKVKYPRDARPGTEISCVECEEVFVPPELKANSKDPRKKAYDPHEEEIYRAEKPIDDPDAKAKGKKIAAAVHHARRQASAEARGSPKPFLGGPEIILLILAGVFAVAIPIGFAVARRFPSIGETGIVLAVYCGLFVGFGVKVLRAKSRLGG